MGNKNSNDAATQRRLAWAMPSWCIDDYVVTPRTVELVSNSWLYCMSGKAPPFLAAHSREPSLTPLVFFYNQFYYFLFELLPEAKHLFTKGMKAQGRMLANVIKFIVTNLEEKSFVTFKQSLTHLAKVHNARGITADQYSVMGMCLVHTVRLCCGTVYFTDETKDAWVQVYSKMMSVIIPVVISGELPDTTDPTGNQVFNYKQVEPSTKNKEEQSKFTTQRKGDDEDGGSQRGSRQNNPAGTPKSGADAYQVDSKAGSQRNTPVPFERQDSPSPCPHPLPIGTSGVCPVTGKGSQSSNESPSPSNGSGGCPVQPGQDEQDPDISHNLVQHLSRTAATAVEAGRAEHEARMRKGDMPHSDLPISNLPSVAESPTLAPANPMQSKYARLHYALEVAARMEKEIDVCDRRVGLSLFPACFVGREAVQWMVGAQLVTSISGALRLLNLLLEKQVIAPVDTEESQDALHASTRRFQNDVSYYMFVTSRSEADAELSQERKNKKKKPAPRAVKDQTLPNAVEDNKDKETSDKSVSDSDKTFKPRFYAGLVH